MSEVINGIQVIEVRGIRVLTTQQLADAYGTDQWRIRENFKRNRNRYTEGKHYIKLEGKELKDWKERVQFAPNLQREKRECEFQTLLKGAKCANLWTERGALLHAKSLNTDQAGEVYDRLVDFYFRAKERQQDKPKEKQAAVAPVQPQKQEKKPSKVVKAKPEKPKQKAVDAAQDDAQERPEKKPSRRRPNYRRRKPRGPGNGQENT